MSAPTDSVFGLTVEALPEGWQPLDVAVIVKCLDENGTVRLASRYNDTLNGWEALGMLDLEHQAQRQLLVNLFETDSGGDSQ